MSEFQSGLKDYVRAERIVREHGMWPLLCVPGLVSLMNLVSDAERVVS